jgi:predicted metalloenzyme YecM
LWEHTVTSCSEMMACDRKVSAEIRVGSTRLCLFAIIPELRYLHRQIEVLDLPWKQEHNNACMHTYGEEEDKQLVATT